MNPVFNRMCSCKEMFSADYFKMLLFSYILWLFRLGIQDQLLWLCSQSHHCWCKSPLLRRKCHLKGLLTLFCLINFSFASKYLIKTSFLLPFICILPWKTKLHNESQNWISELLCLTVTGYLIIFTTFSLLPLSIPFYVCENFSLYWSLLNKRWKI